MSDRTNVQTMPQKSRYVRLAQCKNLKEAFACEEFEDLVKRSMPKGLMEVEAMVRACTQAAAKSPLIFECNMRQALGAFLSLSYLGLPPGSALGLSHVIPFRTKRWNPNTKKREPTVDLQVIIGYPGYLELATRSGHVVSVHTDVVREGDEFEHEYGSHKFLKHKKGLRRTPEQEKADPICAYAFATMKDGAEEFEVMTWAEVLRVREYSQSYQTARTAKAEAEAEGKRDPYIYTQTPWVRDVAEMARKSAFRRLAKWLPKCPELRAGVALEEAHDRDLEGGEARRPDYGTVIDQEIDPIHQTIPDIEDGGEPVDPGTAYRIQDASTETTETVSDSLKVTDAATSDNPPEDFWAVLSDAWGDVVGEPFRDPAAFARAFRDLYEATNKKDHDNLFRHNADELDVARQSVEAFAILLMLDNAEALDLTVQPPPGRGNRSDWPAYVKAIKIGIGGVPKDALVRWTEAQRETLGRAPLQDRVMVIGHITSAFRQVDLAPPEWLAQMMRSGPDAPAAE